MDKNLSVQEAEQMLKEAFDELDATLLKASMKIKAIASPHNHV